MSAGLLFALSLPGLVVLLVVLAAVEQVASRARRRSPLTGAQRPALSASGLDALAGALSPGRALQREQQRVEQLLRDDEQDGAPPAVDLDGGTAHLRLG